MKKLIIVGMLAISFIATAQLSKSKNLNYKDTLITSYYNDSIIESLPSVVVEEEDAPFDFNTKDYLPLGFNPYAKEQAPFKFEAIVEEDAAFDFDTKKYLPKGFDPYKGLLTVEKSTL